MLDCHVHGRADSAAIASARCQGVDRVGLIGWGPEVLRYANGFPDFVLPIVQADLRIWRAREAEFWMRSGAVGIKFTMPEAPYSDRRYWPLYDACAEHNVPAVFHSGYLGRYGPPSLGVHMDWTRPAELDYIARNWPELTLVMAHFGNPWWDEAYKVLAANPNVYADLSGGSAYKRDLGTWAALLAPNGKPSEACRRLMFGTDKTLGTDYSARLPEYTTFHDALLERLGLDAHTVADIYAGNAERVFHAPPSA